jgi:ribose/xylose/arabinose/galactoside ABC-type transport system permease subunit
MTSPNTGSPNTTSRASGLVREALRSRLIWPVLALAALLVTNVIKSPGFFSIRIQDGHLFGSLIDILRNGAPIVLVALGMTLVIATRGIDLSVGAVVAISGAFALSIVGDAPDPNNLGVVLFAVGASLVFALVLGSWNGFLVSVLGIQPIIATLILMTAGRGIAMLITEGQILTVSSAPYKVIGGGYWFALPASIIIAAALFIVVAVLTRKTALGMLIESVGINPEASRLAGVSSRVIIWTVYTFSAVCAAIAGLMISSNVTAADANSAGLWIEMDAILAVVLGGTSLAGGRYSLTGTLIGAFVIQTLTTTVYSVGIAPEITLVFKALVVIAVCLLQSPRVRGFSGRSRRTPPPAVGVAAGASTRSASSSPAATAAQPKATTR